MKLGVSPLFQRDRDAPVLLVQVAGSVHGDLLTRCTVACRSSGSDMQNPCRNLRIQLQSALQPHRGARSLHQQFSWSR